MVLYLGAVKYHLARSALEADSILVDLRNPRGHTTLQEMVEKCGPCVPGAHQNRV
jgi:hypothetical protein